MALKHTYAKLKDGSWGARVSGPAPRVGDTVTVTKSSGETKQETIARVLFTGPDKYNHGQTTSLCSITQTQRHDGGEGSRGRRTGCWCGSIEGVPRDSDCKQCRFDSE